MGFYEHIKKEEVREEEEKYQYIIFTNCALKNRGRNIILFLFRAKKSLKMQKGERVNLKKLPEYFEMENKWEGGKMKFQKEMILSWIKEEDIGNESTKYRLGSFLIEFIGKFTKFYGDVERRIRISNKVCIIDHISPRIMGMMIPPIPWPRDKKGGYSLNHNMVGIIRNNFTERKYRI